MPTLSRKDAQKIIEEAGGIVTSSISKNTDFLVIGDKPGSKLAKAQRLEIKIINQKKTYLLIHY